jgi:hypothetical protein
MMEALREEWWRDRGLAGRRERTCHPSTRTCTRRSAHTRYTWMSRHGKSLHLQNAPLFSSGQLADATFERALDMFPSFVHRHLQTIVA